MKIIYRVKEVFSILDRGVSYMPMSAKFIKLYTQEKKGKNKTLNTDKPGVHFSKI